MAFKTRQWVLISDETRIGLMSDDYRQRIWRVSGHQKRLSFARVIAPFEEGTILIWSGIILTVVPINFDITECDK